MSKLYMATEVHLGCLHLLLTEEGKSNIDPIPLLGVPPELTHQSAAPSDSPTSGIFQLLLSETNPENYVNLRLVSTI
jgi:hypothetical protein